MHGSAARRHPAIVERAVAEGNELGNHQWDDRPCLSLSPSELEDDLRRTHEVLAQHAPVDLMRPGSGLIRRAQLERVHALGYRCALGSIYPYDAWLPAGPWLAADLARRAVPGSIIILHEGCPARATVVALLERLPPALRARGLEVTTVRGLRAR